MTRFRWWMPVVLATLCAAAYANTFHAPFIFDDITSIIQNPAIRRLWPLSNLTANHVAQLDGRLVVSFSLAVNYALGGYNVVGYHLFNLAVHILNAMLAFGILRHALTSTQPPDAPREDMTWLAYAGTVLWSLHPLLTESVTYVSQRAESMMALFLLLTLYCSIRGMQSPSRAFWFDSAMVACVLGMCTKEVMVVTPFVVLAYDYVFVAPSLRAALRSRRKLYLGLAATWVILAALQFAANERWKARQGAVPLQPWDYLKMQSGVIVHYLRLAAWPRGLVLDYSDMPQTVPLSALLPRALLLVSFLVASLWAVRQRRWWGFWGAWFFLTLAPTSSLLPLPFEPATERRMYLPLLAVIAVSLGGVHHLSGRLWARFRWPDRARVWLQTAATIVLALPLGVATFQRNAQYRTARSIWSDVLAKHPHNARAETNLALAYLDEGKPAEAIPHFLAALRLDPDEPIIRNDYATTLLSLGQMDEAIAQYQETLRRAPDYAPARKALGLISQHRFRAELEHDQAALAAHPSDPAAHVAFAQLLNDMGRRDEAITHYQQALQLDPNNASAHYNLANLLADYGRDDEALSHYTAAARRAPNDPRIQINLGNLFLKQARWDKAIAAYGEALHLDPAAFEAHNNIAIAFANRGNLTDATAHFREAARLNPQQPEIHNELAEILDRQGLHDEAQRESAEAQRLTEVAPPK